MIHDKINTKSSYKLKKIKQEREKKKKNFHREAIKEKTQIANPNRQYVLLKLRIKIKPYQFSSNS